MNKENDMEHHQEIISLALDKMLNKQRHFSICTVDKLAETLGVNQHMHPDYKFLSALHCVHYTEMSLELKQKLPEMIMTVLSGRFETGLMAKALMAVRGGEIKNLPETEDDNPTRSLRLAKR